MRKAGTSGAITRQAIREAAIELIATHGFESMSLRDLAAKCGIKAGSLYNYFGSQAAYDPGANNYMVLKDPAVDTLINGLVKANTHAQMLTYAHALDRVLQWSYLWIPNYYPPGTSAAWWNRFGRPAIEAKNDEALETWWEISPTPLTNEQMNAELKKRAGAR